MHLTNSKLMQSADSTAIHVNGIPSTLLMRNASRGLAGAAMKYLTRRKSAVIFCGHGNNGGDGIGCGIYLLLRGVDVSAVFTGNRDRMSADTEEMERRLNEIGGELIDFQAGDAALLNKIREADVIIDAMFGIGLRSALSGAALAAAELINASGKPVIAADIPSGVAADTGAVYGTAVRCTETITFSMAKLGHFVEPGVAYTGHLTVADIGIPQKILDGAATEIFAVSGEDVSLPKRDPLGHKGDHGRLLIIGGSLEYSGAPNLSARAAVRSGAGLVSLGVPSDIYQASSAKNSEAMTFPLASSPVGTLSLDSLPVILGRLSGSDAALIGPGLGRSEDITQIVSEITLASETPLVIDADGLFALSKNPEILSKTKSPLVLTPHFGEFQYLGGPITGDRVADAVSFAAFHGCALVLKGHRTLCAFPDGEVYIISAGNPGMAKGGSGDVLAGMIGAMLCQLPFKEAVVTAAFIHARSGDLCAAEFGEYSMTPSDIIDMIPRVELELKQNNKTT